MIFCAHIHESEGLAEKHTGLFDDKTCSPIGDKYAR